VDAFVRDLAQQKFTGERTSAPAQLA